MKKGGKNKTLMDFIKRGDAQSKVAESNSARAVQASKTSVSAQANVEEVRKVLTKSKQGKEQEQAVRENGKEMNILAPSSASTSSSPSITSAKESMTLPSEVGKIMDVNRKVQEDVQGRILSVDSVRVIVPNNASLEPLSKPFLRPRKVIDSVKEAFLLQVDYDGDAKKALLVFYDPNSHELLFLYDKTGHKPYFLTDIPEEKFRNSQDPVIRKIVMHQSFDHVEIVKKFDLLYNIERVMTKIVVKDPLAVRYLRTKVAKAWEADIRYHVNYIYDNQLIPGIAYSVSGTNFIEHTYVDEKKLREEIIKNLDLPTHEHVDVALHLAKIFEAKWFSPKRIAIDIEVYTPIEGRVPSPDTAEYPVISIALASTDGLNKVLVLYRNGLKLDDKLPEDVEVEIYDSERALILDFLNVLQMYPIVISFNGDNFDFRYIYVRALRLGLDKEALGIEVRRVVKGNRVEFEAKLRNSIHIDLYKFFSNKAIQNYAFEGRYKEVNLDSVAQALLGIGKVRLETDISRASLNELVRYNIRDAQITLELTTYANELVWKLILLLMRVSKLGLEDLTRSTVSVWIKNLFYWEHRRRGYLIPRKDDIANLKGKKVTEATIKGKKYAGAIVMEPPQGLFFNVTVLDFASLYPSIMKRWNISYETIDPDPSKCNKIADIVDEQNRVIHKVCMDRPGITALIVGLLRDFRVRLYKKKAKDKSLNEVTRSWYDVVQRAMKVFINAAYGVFGAETFQLYAPSVAESVTALGRRVITATKNKALEMGLIVLYGDTDSLFIWNPEESKLNELRKWVEETFGLELEVDKTYKFVAFSSLKKNYVGVLSTGEIDVKGMVGKKRNTPDFIKNLFIYILKELATISEPEDAFKVIDRIREELEKHYKLLKFKIFSLDEVAFRATLSKPLSEYKKSTPQHVKAALMLSKYGMQIMAGDVIAYIKVKSKEGVKPIQLAKVSEIDVQKYIDAMRTSLEQLFTALGISWEDIAGSAKIV